MNIISILIGITCAILMVLGLLIGILNWIIIAGCVLGIIFGALSKKKSGLIINIAVMAVCFLRLIMGGGIF